MISVKDFWHGFKRRDITFFSGVPCSLLTSIINYAVADTEITYIPAPREDAALGIASGGYIAGTASGILIQNSGLGNVINALTSFNLMYEIPVLMVITWRGYMGKDAPEHLVMGGKTVRLLEELRIPCGILEENNLENLLDKMNDAMLKRRTPAAIILRKGIVG